MEVLPNEVGNLRKLQELHIHSNELNVLPRSIGNLQELKKLILNDNNLISLPIEISNLKSLELLYISNNPLEFIPDLSKLTNLKELGIRDTKIQGDRVAEIQKQIPNCKIFY